MSTCRQRRLRIAVASEQALVGESVRAALAGRSLDPVVVRWPGVPDPQTLAADHAYDAGLIVSDLDRWSRVRAVELLLTHLPTPWVVLTSARRGPVWGLAAGCGAAAVLPSGAGLDEVTRALVAAARGEFSMDPDERERLAAQWAVLRARRLEQGARVQKLTPREGEVLQMLYAGDPVGRIAELLEVSPATVRSQVKSVLRKLDVSSQLAAVAAFSYVVEGEVTDPAIPR